MKWARLIFFTFFFCSSLSLFALQEGVLNERTLSIEVILSRVDVNIQVYDGKAISYRAEIEDGKKVSIIEDRWCVRFSNSHPVKGVVNIFVPKDKRLESCRIYATSLNVNISGLSSIYFVVSMCDGKVNIDEATFKTASFTLSSALFNFNGKITATGELCASETVASMTIKGSYSDYNFFYLYEASSALTLDGKLCTKDDRYPLDKSKKKRLSITQTSSKTVLDFVKES